MKTKFTSLMTLLLVFVVQLTFAQTKTVTGTVADEDGLPLPGVNVVVKGTTSGTTTDFDGKYTIEADQGEMLEFSFLGFETLEKEVGSSSVMNIKMTTSSETFGEMVITY